MAKSPSSGEVLIIDDTLYNLQLLVTMLSKTGYVVRPANSGSVGLRTARQRTPDIVLLDINMPGMNGYQVCEALKADPALKDIPVLFISAHDEVFDKIRAFEVGGVDYITKPFQSQEVIARVQTHLMLHRREQELEAMVKQQRDYFQRMADLQNEFFTSAVHDLKNPLNLIIGNTYLLKDIISAEGNQYIERIEHAAGFMNVLISDMLDLARIESGIQFHKEEVLLQAYMQDIFRRQVQGNTRVEADLFLPDTDAIITEIGRASCRERV
jgi:two-component system, sensor histidine kinase and response regulator